MQLAAAGARCDYALFVGASQDNATTVPELAPRAAGLKMYLNETYTTLRLPDLTIWRKVRRDISQEYIPRKRFATCTVESQLYVSQ